MPRGGWVRKEIPLASGEVSRSRAPLDPTGPLVCIVRPSRTGRGLSPGSPQPLVNDMALLKIQSGALAGQEFELSREGPNLIGRNPQVATVLIPDQIVSSRHCQILFDGAGLSIHFLPI